MFHDQILVRQIQVVERRLPLGERARSMISTVASNTNASELIRNGTPDPGIDPFSSSGTTLVFGCTVRQMSTDL